MSEVCTDNRFEVIAAYKKKLIESTNIEADPDEMAVIDNVLFRFWQLGWLPPVPHGRLIDADALEYYAENIRDPMGRTELTVMWEKIKRAPTVIPPEEESDD